MRMAPQWIHSTKMRYERTRLMWRCVAVFGWLGFFGFFICSWAASHDVSPGAVVSALWFVCAAGWLSLDFLRPELRAQRYGVAVNGLVAAIVRYEENPELSDSTLNDTDERVREALHVERIRTAPAWIRDKRRRCRLRLLRRVSPLLLVMLSIPAALYSRAIPPWLVYVIFTAVFIVTVAAPGRRRLKKAHDILKEAIDRYEFESAATDSALHEADERASQILAG